MKSQKDFKKEWEKVQKQLSKFSKDAVQFAKRGEREFVKISEKGILHIDSTTVGLQKEKLFYLIGKEYVRLKDPKAPTAKLKKLIEEVNGLDQKQRSIKRKLKPVKTTAAKKS